MSPETSADAFNDAIKQSVLLLYRAGESEDSLGVVLRGHFLLEIAIRDLLAAGMLYPIPDEVYERHLSLRSKAQLCIGLGLLPEEWLHPISVATDMRNSFAHKPTYEVSRATLGGLIGALPQLGKDIYKARGRSTSTHGRIIDFYFVAYIAIRAYTSAVLTSAQPRAKQIRSKPPWDVFVRAIINTRNKSFQIPEFTPTDDPRKTSKPIARKSLSRSKRSLASQKK